MDHAVALFTILGMQEDLDKVKAIRDYANTAIASIFVRAAFNRYVVHHGSGDGMRPASQTSFLFAT